MRSIILFFGLLVWTCAACAMSLPAFILDADLDRLDGEGRASIRSFLPADGLLVLIAWDSDCEHCLENVAEAAGVDLALHGAALLGVNKDFSRWDGLGFVLDRGIAYPQLHDPDGLVADAFGAGDTSFSFALLDPAGNTVDISYDSVPDARARITRALEAAASWRERTEAIAAASATPAADAATTQTPPPHAPLARATSLLAREQAYPRLDFGGETRIRWLGVRTENYPAGDGDCACGLAGPHGEALQPMARLLYRFTLELKARLAEGVSVGGMLRVGNEDPEILREGPAYLGDASGSAFAELRRGAWSGRLGYYDTQFSALTLQRWDLADNPPSSGVGSNGACGSCGGTSRALSLESLDGLSTVVTFEGARVLGAPRPWLTLEALYARPRQARPFVGSASDDFAYRQDLFGARLGFAPWGRGKRDPVWHLNYVNVSEDSNSADWPAFLPDDPLSFIHSGEVYSLDLSLPLNDEFTLGGELAGSYSRSDRIDGRGEGVKDSAWLLTTDLVLVDKVFVSLGWLHIEPDFASPFGALSYLANSEGPRAAVEYLRDDWGLRIFAKRLMRVDSSCEAAGGMPYRLFVAGGLLNLKLEHEMEVDIAGSLTREEQLPCTGDCVCDQYAFSLTARRKLARACYLEFEYTNLQARNDKDTGRANGDMLSVFLTAKF